ncbi:dihydrofolate synthase / folylpolyglutamate synthase [Brevinema andersonii]|uniref:Dihydrofolate synthase / folylpolyglutamate synthase n=1 Tax=Brevinema andersonii TaxID=34097 RepID=A0A1I1D9W7_BREAD|nr:Mur ligase family protein [Brevinema andersonii]SFB71142.1 dihydrofolate synthase / folylpolyglutamate synthase [Brevinema andersonii]
MNFKESAQAIMNLGVSNRNVDLSVYPRRVAELLQNQGFDPNQFKFFHVTGSKGKGSLSRTIFQLLTAERHKVGLFTSPHIFSIRERFEDNDGLISEQDFINLVNKYLPLFRQYELHFFEACLFLALVYFSSRNLEYVVLEVGIGGRFDPTNFCVPECALIGHISMEHRDFLGDTIQKIAYDKAGIMKPGILTFSADQSHEVRKIFEDENKGKLIFFHDAVSLENFEVSKNGCFFDLYVKSGNKVAQFPKIFLKRLSYANVYNFCLAVAAVEHVLGSLSQDSVNKTAVQSIPYRMQLFDGPVLADTAHNGQSFLNLCRTLDEWLQWKDVILYVSVMDNKEFQDIADVLAEYRHLWSEIRVFDFETPGRKISGGIQLYEKLDNMAAVYLGILDDSQMVRLVPYTCWAGSFYSIPLFESIRMLSL